MANKEFQVRHGLIVNTNLLVANVITGNVAITGNVSISNTLAFGPFGNTRMTHSGNTFAITLSSANVLVMNPNTTGILFDVVNTSTSLRVFSVSDTGNVYSLSNVYANNVYGEYFYGNVVGTSVSANNVAANNLAANSLVVTGNVVFDTNTFYLDSPNNKIGIGNTTPAVNLDVKGIISTDAFIENPANITTSYTITTGRNAMSAGPITINNGVTVTVPSGSTWTIV